jgi:hypothetical protein
VIGARTAAAYSGPARGWQGGRRGEVEELQEGTCKLASGWLGAVGGREEGAWQEVEARARVQGSGQPL